VTITLTDDQDALVKRVCDCHSAAEKVHKTYRGKWDHFHGLYRNYTAFKRAYAQATPRDRDEILYTAQQTMGAQLFIPMCFSTVETVLPRAISTRPRMVLTPRNQLGAQNEPNMRVVLDAQQSQIFYELILQDVGKDGFIYGLGVQKTYWKTTTKTIVRQQRRIYGDGYYLGEHRETDFDDPVAESVDPWDFFWDPMGHDIESCDYVIHRTWRNTQYVIDMLSSGRWQLDGWTEEDVRGGKATRYSEVRAGRNRVEGITDQKPELHEVWEFHTGTEIITVLDRQWPVQHATNPFGHGEIPFQVFRPTKVTHQMVGIGEIEPIEDLQEEINTLRSQRRDNATLKLMQSYAYAEGMVDPNDVKFGAGMLIPVLGDPREFLFPLNVGDIPNSSYREEEALVGDIDRTSGVSDAISGGDPGGGVSSTATGAQLVQAAANKRIENKARRLEVEIIAAGCRQWVVMNQVRIRDPRPYGIEQPPSPDQPERMWSIIHVGPEELAGLWFVAPEGGTTAPPNIPQMRQDGMMKLQALGQRPDVNQPMLMRSVAKDFGFENPDSILVPQQQQPEVPPEVLDMLVQRGVPKQLVAEVLHAALAQQNQQQQAPQQPTNPNQAQLPAAA
jgi:hypothetical protein